MFQNILKEVEYPTPEDLKMEHQTLLYDIVGKWSINKMYNPKLPVKIPRLIEK